MTDVHYFPKSHGDGYRFLKLTIFLCMTSCQIYCSSHLVFLENNDLNCSGCSIAGLQIVVDFKLGEEYLFADLIYYKKGEEDVSCMLDHAVFLHD